MVEKVIMDGDGGGDEMQLLAVLLAHPEEVKVLGATAVFGNTHHDQVFENTRNILHFLKAAQVPVYPGAKGPSDSPPLPGDDAHGNNGIGGVELDASPAPREKQQAVDFILQQLRDNEPGTITISASGPLTNIAQAIAREPETMKRVKRIIIMGGCTHDLPAADMPWRKGNTTPHAEFNFYMASQDASTVMGSGLPITLVPMNCTQQLSLTLERKNAIEKAFLTNPKARDAVLGMMTAPADLDRMKFNSDSFMHDVHCAFHVICPEMYNATSGKVTVSTEESTRGRTDFTPGESNIRVATGLKKPDMLFEIFLESLKTCLSPSRRGEMSLG